MGTTTKLTFEEYEQIREHEDGRYELDEGTLVMEPSPTWRHNSIRDRLATALREFVASHKLGEGTVETEFRLARNTARTPDIAFVTSERFKTIDIDRSPVEGAPDLAVEVISPANRAEEMMRKVHQYLDSGCRSVWVIYPGVQRAEIHSKAGVQRLRESDSLKEEKLLPGFELPLSKVLSG